MAEPTGTLPFAAFEWMLSLRYLRARRREGFISVIAGFVVLVWPFDSIVVLVLVTGVWLVVMGVVQTVQAFQVRRDAKTLQEAVESVSERLAPRRRVAAHAQLDRPARCRQLVAVAGRARRIGCREFECRRRRDAVQRRI